MLAGGLLRVDLGSEHRCLASTVLGGGLGMNGDLLLQPVRALLQQWLPYPPRVEISSLGENVVHMGAVATGLQAALDNVFVNRPRALPATQA